LFGDGRVTNRPIVTLTLIGMCVVAYIAELASPNFTQRFQFIAIIGADEPWRFVTAAFLHAGMMHIVFNMVALWMVGPFLEASLGRARYITLYLLAALGGSTAMVVAAYVTQGERAAGLWLTGVVGASGAVFGLFGAVLVCLRRTGNSARGIVGVIVVNALIPLFVPGIAWQAHLGGLVVGAALGAAYAYAPKENRRHVSLAASAAMGVLVVGLAMGVYKAAGLLWW
jgi:membrane associated rhomboid family serine protease